MASLFAPVEDGKIVETASQASLKKANSQNNNGMDKEAFLQLLVAQMQYQDPLEPTSNTEYVSQYAQFSQVEQIQNMAATTELARASALVGETVYIKTNSSSGYVEGKVDYVVFENNKAYLAIDESLYSIDDLDTIVDTEYKKAFDKAYDFTLSLNMLPRVSAIDLSYRDKMEKLIDIYEGMNDYEKSFLAEETVDRYEEYVKRWNQVKLADGEYKAAFDKAENFKQSLDDLPAVSAIDMSCQDKMEGLINIYEGMSEYEKSFLDEKTVEKYEKYAEKWGLVKLVSEADKLLQMAAEKADQLQQTASSMAESAAAGGSTTGSEAAGGSTTGSEAAGGSTTGSEAAGGSTTESEAAGGSTTGSEAAGGSTTESEAAGGSTTGSEATGSTAGSGSTGTQESGGTA